MYNCLSHCLRKVYYVKKYENMAVQSGMFVCIWIGVLSVILKTRPQCAFTSS